MSEEKKEVEEQTESITTEEMQEINNAKIRVKLASAEAETAAAVAKVTDLEYRSLVQHIFIKYHLGVDDRIDDGTGNIVRGGAKKEGQE
ncbi:MAG TPA: hypothetical protein VKN14_03080 [Flavobacteriaceae bacterium]|nr:hypothetical protein [Flavobacteriaceae bacterium]